MVVLAHNYVPEKAVDFLADKKKGTHLTWDSLMNWMKDKEVFIVTDIKVGQYQDSHHDLVKISGNDEQTNSTGIYHSGNQPG